MSDIGLIMNGLLGVLLVGALALGWRLEGRLKVLRASHESFTRAVEDLDRAAARAEQGLADLRAATDEAAETLAMRIERATLLAGQLAKLTADAERAETRLAAMPRSEAPRFERAEAHRVAPARAEPLLGETAPVTARAATARPAASRESSFARFAERYGARPAHSPAVLAEAAVRGDLILEDEVDAPVHAPSFAPRIAPEAVARMERLRALARTPAAIAPNPPRPVDDELFDAPPLRAAGGVR